MQKEKKIKYPLYKYEAYKNLNKLFLDWLQRSHGIEVNGSVQLHFEISHYVSSNSYSVRASYNGYQICLVTYKSAEDCDIFTEIGQIGYQSLEHDFSSKMVSYLKQLLKYKLQENVEYFYFYADYFRIAYTSKDKNCEIIENARSGQPEKGKSKHLEKGKSKFYAG